MSPLYPHVVLIDLHNQIHRARNSAFVSGNHAITFNFFRLFKKLITDLKATRVIVADEGVAQWRRDLFPTYKANRKIETDPLVHASWIRQRDTITELLKSRFPVSVIRHPEWEADDAIHNSVVTASKAIPITIVSSDTDFIQTIQEFDHVKLYDPTKKNNRKAPVYPYVIWKALRGDPSDNIPGLPGIGEKRAEALASTSQVEMNAFLEKKGYVEQFNKNMELIKFKTWSTEQRDRQKSSQPEIDWNDLRATFASYGFSSIVGDDKKWNKFVEPFERLLCD